MRSTDQETAIEKIAYYLFTVPKRRVACIAMGWEGAQGSTRVCQEAERARAKHGSEPLLWFPWEGMGEAR